MKNSMKNRITRISPERKQELRELIDLIQQESYKQGYEDGKFVQSVDNVEQIHDKWIAERKPNSANQQRAELIDKAKIFVEVHKDKDGDVRHRLGWFTPEFYRKKNRVTCVLKCYDTNRVYGVGRANCMPGDVFNGQIGEAISLAKAIEEDIPVEFLEAVQPNEIVVGMEVFYGGRIQTVDLHEKWLPVGVSKEFAMTALSCNIIDDTNAQYEVGE